MSSIVYYGVGKRLKNNEENFLSETGLPICMCDADTQKQHETYIFGGDKCFILSVEEALEKYGECDFYITVGGKHFKSCVEYLLQHGVQNKNIKTFGGLEYKLGCDNLYRYVYIQSMDIKVCAHPPYGRVFPYNNEVLSENDVIDGIKTLEDWRIKTLEALRRGEKTTCDGCSALQYGLYPSKPQVNILGVGPNFAGGTKCNCRCFYCNQVEAGVIGQKSNQILSNFDIHRIAGDVYDSIKEIILADGEPSLLPRLDELCELAIKKNWSVNFNTNGILYSDVLVRALSSNPNSRVAVALDSGTRETYKKIKRVDTFDKVLENLGKYEKAVVRIFLKYILCPGLNDNVEDMNKFVEIAKNVHATKITLSQNFQGIVDGVKVQKETNRNMSENMFMCFSYLVARLNEEGFAWDFQVEFISAHDLERMEKLR